MAYDDNYVDRNTMKGNCQVDSTGTYPNEIADDAPGQPAGCKFIAPGEDITSAIANRTRYQLAHNCDIIKGPMDVLKAIGEVGAFTVTGGGTGSVTVDPTDGGSSDVNFDGYLYLGDTSGWPTGQEGRNLLFGLMDENYDQVEVGGVPVVVSAVSQSIPGGFYNGGIVTLTLSDTIPDGNYRLAFARDTTIATLPEAGLMKLDVRGLTDSAAEMTHKSWWVCAVDTSSGPADFVGTTAVQDALAAVGDNSVLFVRAGSYDLAVAGGGAQLDITQSRVHIIGEGADAGGTEFVVASTEHLYVTGSRVTIEGVQVTFTSGGSYVRVEGNDFHLKNSYLYYVYLFIVPGADRARIEDVKIDTNIYGIRLAADFCYVSQCNITMNGDSPATKGNPGLYVATCSYARFEDVQVLRSGTTCDQVALELNIDARDASFVNCDFVSGVYPAMVYGQYQGTPPYSPPNTPISAHFENCLFSNYAYDPPDGDGFGPVMPANQGIPQFVRFSFTHCRFKTDSSAWYPGPFVELLARHPHDKEGWTTQTGEAGITLNNCYFYDNWCKGYDGTVDPPGDASGATPCSVLSFDGVTGQGVIFERHPDYDVLCSPWVDAVRTDIVGLRVVYDVDVRPCDTNVAAADGALVRIGKQCRIQKLRVTGNMGHGSEIAGGEWKRPVLNLYASGVVVEGQSEVDDFRIEQKENTDVDPYPVNWEFNPGTTVVRVSTAILRRFRWDSGTSTHRNSLSDTIATQSIIRLDDYGVLEDARISHSDYGKLLTYVIELSGPGSEIRQSYISLSQPAAAAVNMTAMIAELAASSYSKVIGNRLFSYSNIPTSGVIVDVSGSGADKMVSNNNIYVISTVSSNLIDFGGSVGDDDNVCVGNIVHNGSSGVPDIRPNTVVGYNTNLILT